MVIVVALISEGVTLVGVTLVVTMTTDSCMCDVGEMLVVTLIVVESCCEFVLESVAVGEVDVGAMLVVTLTVDASVVELVLTTMDSSS